MRKIFFTCLFMLSLYTYGQNISADPAVSQIGVSDINNSNLNANSIPLDNIIKLKIPIYNLDAINGLPAGSCKIKIGLGSKLILSPQFDFSSLPSSAYFDWSAEIISGQVQITGDLKTDLPANFLNIAEFNIEGSVTGNSTVTTNFLVTNHNTTVILSDEVPNNNSSSLPYTIAAGGPLPVVFKELAVTNRDCSIQVDLSVAGEINVNKYEVEISKDGVNFSTTGEIAGNNVDHYKYSFPITESIKTDALFVRIKSIDKDGKFTYTATKVVKGLCGNAWDVGVYPNPAIGVRTIILNTKDGLFDGHYLITLSDMAGKILLKKESNLVNVNHVNLETGNLSAAQYIISVHNKNGGQSSVVKWQKY